MKRSAAFRLLALVTPRFSLQNRSASSWSPCLPQILPRRQALQADSSVALVGAVDESLGTHNLRPGSDMERYRVCTSGDRSVKMGVSWHNVAEE